MNDGSASRHVTYRHPSPHVIAGERYVGDQERDQLVVSPPRSACKIKICYLAPANPPLLDVDNFP